MLPASGRLRDPLGNVSRGDVSAETPNLIDKVTARRWTMAKSQSTQPTDESG